MTSEVEIELLVEQFNLRETAALVPADVDLPNRRRHRSKTAHFLTSATSGMRPTMRCSG
jgi:hypothetical protein